MINAQHPNIEDSEGSVAGRIKSVRNLGNILFIDVNVEGQLVQGVFKEDNLGKDLYTESQLLKEEYLVRISGEMSRSKKRTISIDVKSYDLISKSLKEHRGLITNPEYIRVRSDILFYTRDYLRHKGFIEVEIPVIYRGTTSSSSREFTTKHNNLGEQLSLRKSMDLFMRRLSIQDFDKIYSIGQNFRNEPITKDKLPEFTMLTVLGNYMLMEEVIGFSRDLAGEVSKKIGKNDAEFNKNYDIVTFKDFVRDFVNTDIPYNSAKRAKGSPTFVYSFPFNTNSIARTDVAGNLREFKLIMGGSTIIHGYEEITDPKELRERLIAQGGNLDNTELEELLKEMNYEAPPATSFGLSIDRLTMFLSGAKSIKEVIAFPFSRLR